MAGSEQRSRIDTLDIDHVSFEGAVDRIVSWALDRTGGYVCTPNVDHVVRARRDPAFRLAVLGARLRLPDGMGVVYGSRIAGDPVPGTVTGRLLPEAVAQRLSASGAAIAFFGGPPGVAHAAAERLRSRGMVVTDAFGPGMGFEIGSSEDIVAVERLRKADAGAVFVGLGAPKQERWMAAHAPDLQRSVLVGVGAALDVISGRLDASPPWMTRIGLEWAYRLAHEPRRLFRRYLVDDPRFFWWMARQRIEGKRSES